MVKDSPASAGDSSSIPDVGRSLEKEMAILSSILAWKTTWTEESGGLWSTGFQKESYMTQQLNKQYCREYANLPFNCYF